jgi:mannose-6-phosphate isomerase-like protein (cupin superfamily)
LSVHRDLVFSPMDDARDADDWRPNSLWAVVVDPEANMAVIAEKIAVGDAIPLHVHRIEEVILFLSGHATERVGDEIFDVSAGDIVVIPAGAVHGTRNSGDVEVEIRAVFPSARIDMQYVERNPAPGTEGNTPQPGVVWDMRTGAVEPIDDRG